jgi:hypothetical protein
MALAGAARQVAYKVKACKVSKKNTTSFVNLLPVRRRSPAGFPQDGKRSSPRPPSADRRLDVDAELAICSSDPLSL